MTKEEFKEIKRKGKKGLKQIDKAYKQFKRGKLDYQEVSFVFNEVGIELDNAYEVLNIIDNEYRKE